MTGSAVALPAHEAMFHPNMGFALLRDSTTTIVHLLNYYDEVLFGGGYRQPAVAEVVFFDEEGRKRLEWRTLLQPSANLHLDIAAQLAAAGHAGAVMGSIYCRLIPLEVPAVLKGKRVPTEFTVEIVTYAGSRTFFHNTGAPVRVPMLSRMNSGLIYADAGVKPRYLVVANNYLGPKFPWLSCGFGIVSIVNHRGERRDARTETVPARGLRLFSFDDYFPDLDDFLDGRSGELRFRSANVLRKPWICFDARRGDSSLAIEHL